MQLPGTVGVDHFYEFATCLRCKETGSHTLSCALNYEYPVALILDPNGFCLQARFNTQPPKPSNYGLEPYTYYPTRGLVAYQFREQPGKTSRCRYLHKIELKASTLQCSLASSTPVYGHDIAAMYGSQKERLHKHLPPYPILVGTRLRRTLMICKRQAGMGWVKELAVQYEQIKSCRGRMMIIIPPKSSLLTVQKKIYRYSRKQSYTIQV